MEFPHKEQKDLDTTQKAEEIKEKPC